jgi:hypothetical protein
MDLELKSTGVGFAFVYPAAVFAFALEACFAPDVGGGALFPFRPGVIFGRAFGGDESAGCGEGAEGEDGDSYFHGGDFGW